MLGKFVFITSSSYSGSTLLAYLLGSHSRIATVGEARGLNVDIDPEEYDCSCGEKFLACSFWNDVARRMKSKLSPSFDLRRLNTKFVRKSSGIFDRLQFSDLRFSFLENIRDGVYGNIRPYAEYTRSVIEHNIALAESVSEYYKKDIYLDSSKTPAAITHLSKALPSAFKVIYLFRDGRAVFNSFIKRKRVSETTAIKEWIKINKFIQRKLEPLPGRDVLLVSYTDLCAQPQKTLDRIFNFIGVGYEEQCMKYWAHEHHIIGNDMRLSLKRDIVQDDSWKNNLSPAQLRMFEKAGSKLNHRWNMLFSSAQAAQNCPCPPLSERPRVGHYFA